MTTPVSCQQCLDREAALRATGRRADDVYAVGNRARNEMGHSFYFSMEGRTALCIASRLAQPTPPREATR
jgi:Tfp pilus assembly ATPase PilU